MWNLVKHRVPRILPTYLKLKEAESYKNYKEKLLQNKHANVHYFNL